MGADKGPKYLVDDIVMTGDDPETISWLKIYLRKIFDIKDFRSIQVFSWDLGFRSGLFRSKRVLLICWGLWVASGHGDKPVNLSLGVQTKLCLDGAFRKPVYVSRDWQQPYLSHFHLTGFVSGSNCSEPIYACFRHHWSSCCSSTIQIIRVLQATACCIDVMFILTFLVFLMWIGLDHEMITAWLKDEDLCWW